MQIKFKFIDRYILVQTLIITILTFFGLFSSFIVSKTTFYIENERPMGLLITPFLQLLIVLFVFIGFIFLRLIVNYPLTSQLILAGSFSNLIERLAFGHVKDYINVGIAYINIADIFIWTGLIFLNIQVWLIPILNNKNQKQLKIKNKYDP